MKRRRIKAVDISAIALCKRGKNGLQTLYKEEGKEFARIETYLSKLDPEKGDLFAVPYILHKIDSEGDFIDSEAVLEQIAKSFIRNGGELNIRHGSKALKPEQGEVLEVFQIQKSDERFKDWKDYDGNSVDVTGSTAIHIKLYDEDIKKAYEEDGWNGVSIEGRALVEEVEKSNDSSLDRVLDGLADFFGRRKETITKEEDEDMKPEDIDKIVNSLGEKFGLKPIEKADDKKTEKKEVEITFEGDPTKLEDVQAHLAKIKKAEGPDWKDPKSVQEYLATLEKEEKRSALPDPNEEGITPAVKQARQRYIDDLKKAEGASNQTPGDDGKKTDIKKANESADRVLSHLKQRGASVRENAA